MPYTCPYCDEEFNNLSMVVECRNDCAEDYYNYYYRPVICQNNEGLTMWRCYYCEEEHPSLIEATRCARRCFEDSGHPQRITHTSGNAMCSNEKVIKLKDLPLKKEIVLLKNGNNKILKKGVLINENKTWIENVFCLKKQDVEKIIKITHDENEFQDLIKYSVIKEVKLNEQKKSMCSERDEQRNSQTPRRTIADGYYSPIQNYDTPPYRLFVRMLR